MVDAVDAINTASRIRLQERKDLTLDWNKMSAGEVLSHAQNGDEVPVDILKWAEDYSKLTNAPEDVTYESVNGSTDTEEVQETTGEEETPDEEDAAEKVTLSGAQQERQTMVDQGASLYDQGKTFVGKSNDSTSTVRTMQDNVQALNTRGENIENEANTKTENTINSTKAIKDEYDKLLKQVQDDITKVTPGDLNKLASLGGKLQQFGTRAQNQLANYDMQLQAIETEFSQYDTVPEIATDYGEVTVDVGAELVTRNPEKQDVILNAALDKAGNKAGKAGVRAARLDTYRFIFSRDYRMGIQAIKAGGNALDAGVNGAADLEEAKKNNGQYIDSVNDNKNKIENATYVESVNVNMDETSNDNPDNNKSSSNPKQANKVDNDGVKDNTDIMSDPLAIQKRKEQLGLAT